MASRKRTVEIEVVADTKKAAASLQKIESTVTKTGDKFSLAGKAMVGAFAGGQLISAMGDAIDRAERVGDVHALTAQIIQQTGGAAKVSAEDVRGLAQTLQDLTGIDKALIGEGENVILTFKNIKNEAGEGNDVFDRTVALMLDVSTVMGTDAKSAAMQLGKALNDPVGQMGALSRAGLTFTDQQKDQIRTLAESGDMLGAQTLILDELESQLGGTAIAAADASDKFRNAWNDILEIAGNQLLPVVESAADKLGLLNQAASQDVNLGWSQRLSAAMQTILGDSDEAVQAYIDQKDAENDAADAAENYAGKTDKVRGALGRNKPVLDDTAEATGDLADETDDAAEATDNLAEAQLAAADPALGLLRKYEGFVGAQQKYNDAVKEFGPDSLQARAAAADLLESTAGYNAAQEKFTEEFGPAGVEALKDLGAQAGFYGDDLAAILDFLNRIGRATVNLPSITDGHRGGASGRENWVNFHRGGIVGAGSGVAAGTEVPAILQAGETVIPIGGRRGSGASVVIYQTIVDPSSRVIREQQELARRGAR